MRELAAGPCGGASEDNEEGGNHAADEDEGQYKRGRHRAGSENVGAIVNAIVSLAMVFIVSDFVSTRIDSSRRGAPILLAQRILPSDYSRGLPRNYGLYAYGEGKTCLTTRGTR